MSHIDRRVNGRKITKIIALHHDVQARLNEIANAKAVKAEALLNHRARHRTQTSYISVDKGRVDSYVVLDDTRGLDGALSIEFGRQGQPDPKTGEWKGASEGLFVLHDAFNLRSPRRVTGRPKKGGDSTNE